MLSACAELVEVCRNTPLKIGIFLIKTSKHGKNTEKH